MDAALLANLLRECPVTPLPSGGFLTCVARLSYPALDKPRKIEGSDGEPKYSASLLFPLEADLTLLKAEYQRVAMAQWPNGFPNGLKLSLKKQDDKADTDGYEIGGFYLSASSFRQPGMVDARMNVITNPGIFYGGCYVRASIRIFAYDKKLSKGVSAGLNNLQFLADGDAFGGATRAADDFKPIGSAPAPASTANGATPPTGSPQAASSSLF